MIDFLSGKKILVIVAHPDDELLGAGATFHKLIHEHHCHVETLILSHGITSRGNAPDQEAWNKELKEHQQNAVAAQKAIGFKHLRFADFPDNRFDSADMLDIVKAIELNIQEFGPEVIFTHHGGDTNIDHRITFDAVIAACRPLPGSKIKGIITFETASSTEWQGSNYPNPFLPNWFSEVSSKNIEAKIAGMECYSFEKRDYPHPRSAKALTIQAQRWGVVIGKAFAEAFMLIRIIS